VRGNIALNPAALAVVQVAFDEAVPSLSGARADAGWKDIIGLRVFSQWRHLGSATQFVAVCCPGLA
jgi:hypothetical protein